MPDADLARFGRVPARGSGRLCRRRPSLGDRVWRGPEELAMSPAWRASQPAALIDVPVFGETGLLAGRRGADGRPSPISFGPIVAPRGSPGGIVLAELLPTAAGTVSFRGPMVPQHPFPPGSERSGQPRLKVERSGVVDTGYTFRINSRDARGRCHRPAFRHRRRRRLSVPAAAISRRSPAASTATPRLRRCPIRSSASA